MLTNDHPGENPLVKRAASQKKNASFAVQHRQVSSRGLNHKNKKAWV